MALPSRFDRDYELTVQVGATAAVIVRPPLRISFNATKSISGGLNKATIRIYNLKESNRLALAKDPEQTKRIPISLRVGYAGSLQLLFKGTVHKGANMREGADLITELECLDGGFDYLNSFTSRTVRGGQRTVDAVLSDMPNTAKGKLTTPSALIRPRVLVGASGKLIDDLIPPGATWYIDDEKLFIVRGDEVVSDFIPVISAATGLLNTPSREMAKSTFETLMNPTLKIGGLCSLVSVTAPHLNGVYRIQTIVYNGDSHGAAWSQAVTGILAGNYRVLN